MRLRSPEKDSGSGDQSVVESLHEFSYIFPPISKHDGGRILHVARLDGPRKLDRYDGGARTTLRAVSGLALAAQSCREDKDSDVKWGRGPPRVIIWGWFGGQGNPRGRRPPFPVNGGPVPVAPRACLSSTGPLLMGVLRGRGLMGVGLTETPYLRGIENHATGIPVKTP